MKAPFRSWVEISRSRIAANYQVVRNLVGAEIEICPVVKANAYGHGAAQVARTLIAEGVRWLAVSSIEEGVSLREQGITDPRILVMADFLPNQRGAIIPFRLTPVIHDLDEISLLEELAALQGKPIEFHLKLDTGMGRLGVRAEPGRIAGALSNLSWARFEGLMTHLASAGEAAVAQTAEFDRIYSALPVIPHYRHIAATTGLAAGRREAWKNMVRPGLAIYGYAPASAHLGGLQPALEWKAALLSVKDLPAGVPVGYGGTYRTARPTRIGIVAAGYADGVPRSLANRGCLVADGVDAAVLGAVSMDVTTIDLSGAPHLRPGDTVTIIASDQRHNAAAVAATAGMISYDLLCGIGERVRRVWRW
jgi:alanine racemase